MTEMYTIKIGYRAHPSMPYVSVALLTSMCTFAVLIYETKNLIFFIKADVITKEIFIFYSLFFA
jgi:hypothetical protein